MSRRGSPFVPPLAATVHLEASTDNPLPICIVGQYKCGTSWLLAALSAHPELLGVRELGLLQACCDRGGESVSLTEIEVRNRLLFQSSAWSHGNALERTLAREDDSAEVDLRRPLSIADLPPAEVRRFYRRCQAASSPYALMDDFLALIRTRSPGTQAVVLKSANQAGFVDVIHQWRPDARVVVITRDGRDASISAQQYKKLMEDMPWFGGHKPFQELLRDWVSVAKIVDRHHRDSNLYLLRYEDLTNDFSATLGALLSWLGVRDDQSVLDDIEALTDFERVTGRPRGSEGVGVVRKGAVGEWQTSLSSRQKRAAWKLAKSRLEAFGYSESGEVNPLPRPEN